MEELIKRGDSGNILTVHPGKTCPFFPGEKGTGFARMDSIYTYNKQMLPGFGIKMFLKLRKVNYYTGKYM